MERASFTQAEQLLGKGDYYVAERTFPPVPVSSQEGHSALYCNLQLLRGVGPRTEEKLKSQGCHDLASLTKHGRWGRAACDVIAAIERRDAPALVQCGAPEIDLVSFYSPTDIGFVDIETTGLYSTQPLFLVGVMACRDDGTMLLKQFLARSYEEEAAVLCAVRCELERLRVIATYNGRRFDLPYIRDRMAYHGVSFTMDQFHVDILRLARRLYRSMLPDCRLVTVASHLLGYDRHGDIPSHMIPEVYHDFVKSRNPALIRPILEHNAMDIHALALILANMQHRARG
ncbi:MAG: ribonuclease H-like domain-containing protein [Bacillota bacterium]